MRPTRMNVMATSALAVLFAWPLRAQATATIDSGMTQDSVIKRLGQPLSIRTYGSHTYLSYANGCEKNCGMTDIVTLDSGKVVDAIFRSPGRQYVGKSSSPQMIPASLAPAGMPIDSTGPRHVKVPPGYVAPTPVKKASAERKAQPEKREERRAEPKPAETPPAKPSLTRAKEPPTKPSGPAALQSPAPAPTKGGAPLTKAPLPHPTKAAAPQANKTAAKTDTAKKPAQAKKPN